MKEPLVQRPRDTLRHPGNSESLQNGKERAQYLWGGAMTKVRRADFQPREIGHGLQLLSHLPFPRALRGVTWISQQNLFLSLDSDGLIRQQHMDGTVQTCAQACGPLCGVVFAWHSNKFVAWAHQELLVLEATLTPISQCKVAQGVVCCVYDPGRDQVLSGGIGGVQVWAFSPGSWNLTRQQFLKEGLKDTDKVNIIALDSTAQLTYTCFAACGADVWEYDLRDGELRRVWNNLHLRPITGLVYSEAHQTLISASRDGSIKIWGKSAELKGVCVAHTGPVTALSFGSSGSCFFSSSEDRSLRTWDLETQEQIGEQVLAEPLLGLEAFRADGMFVLSYSEFCLDLWQVQNLYHYHTLLGTSVTDMKMSLGHFGARVACLCSDSAIRLLAAATGELISSLPLEECGSCPLAIEFCAYIDSVYVLLKNGDLLRASSLENPMIIMNTLNVGSCQARPLCLSLYCAIAGEQRVQPDWTQMVKERKYGNTSARDTNRFLPVIGLEDGTICVCDWCPRRVLCHLEAHSPAKVTALMSSPENNLVLSAGSDLRIRTWQMFPHSEESLSPYMSFLCSHPIERMCLIGSQLFVSFYNQSSGSSSLVQYCLQSSTRRDHSPSNDHQDQITGLCSCPTLGLVISSGKDKTIRIWNEHNQLLRILSLDCAPESLTLISQRAELLLGIRGRVCHMNVTSLLPLTHQLKIPTTEPPSQEDGAPVPVQGSVLQSLSEDVRKPLSSAHTLPLRNEVSSCTLKKDHTEEDRIREQNEEQAFLLARDQELLLLMKGKVKPSKKIRSSRETKAEAMKRYLLQLYKEKPSIQIPEMDPSDGEDSLTAPDPQTHRPPYVAVGGSGAFGQNPVIPLSKGLKNVPNSAVLQFFPQSKQDEEEEAQETEWGGLVTQRETKLPVPEHGKEVRKEYEQETTEEMKDLEEEERLQLRISQVDNLELRETEKETPHLPLPPLPAVTRRKTLRAQRRFSSQIPQMRPKSPSSELQKGTLSPMEAAIPMSPEILDRPLPTFSSEPVQLERPQSPSPEEPPQRESSEEQCVVAQPIPPFILQFIQESWFTDIFPEAKEELHCVCEAEFISRLLQGLLQLGHPMRSDILQTLNIWLPKGQLKNLKKIHHCLIQALNPSPGLDLEVPEDREFLFACLRSLIELKCTSAELLVELIVNFVLLPHSYRGQMMALFKKIGVHDSHGYLDKEFSSWDSWEANKKRREDVREICEQWLHQWTQHLKEFLMAVVSSSEPETQAKYQKGRRRRHPDIGKMAKMKAQRTDPIITVTFIEVLNYFCEVQMEKKLQVMKQEPAPNRSTVLALPPIKSKRALLRLGESSKSVRPREDNHLPPVCQPLLPEIIPFINLPLAKVTLNPIPFMLDAPTPLPLTGSLKQDTRRYFMLQQSFASSYC
ncbi:WD repeat-containing protein 97 [Xenopus laevis]|uniref:WD repeat-containing protein 97 n=2 Tax=Xenopus laevis TaxID=8355 RepID=A0A1L8FUB2_XENLA|nr:WD repeat-containing protein 97 [Xenopus laevis]OCT75155.1 hypothetical protein XELAEV_18034146mg [Xenopus laevis]